MKLNKGDLPNITAEIDNIALSNNYTKIIAKVPEWAKQDFLLAGYKKEAFIPKFYNGQFGVYFMAKYYCEKRTSTFQSDKIINIIYKAQEKTAGYHDYLLNSNFKYTILKPEDTLKMAQLYKKVFKTYPFPIFEPEYLIKTMKENIVYFGVWENDKLIALSSSEMDISSQNAEMTDFATLPEYRGKGLATYLLNKMENAMKDKGIITCYSIARAISPGMNFTFAKMGYKYSGTLINNTNISGNLENMNIWFKHLK